MSKTKLFIDCDDTVWNAIHTYVHVYNLLYQYHKDYKRANWEDVSEWNYTKTCHLTADNTNEIFESPLFFKYIKVFPNAVETLKKLSEKYQIITISVGTQRNISNKSLWIEQNLPFIENSIYLFNGGNCKADKSMIDMSGGIFIDDHQNNLYGSNADIRICYTNEYREYKWNKGWVGLKVGNWKEIEEMLL